MHNNEIFNELISDILDCDDVLLSINSGSGICEARIEKGIPFKIRDKWATIGDENRPWHIHLNIDKVKEAKFIKEPRADGKNSYSVRLFDIEGNLSMRANFTKIYDNSGNIIKEKVEKYNDMFRKYGSNESITLAA